MIVLNTLERKNYSEDLILITRIIAWLLEEIDKNWKENYEQLVIPGYITYYDEDERKTFTILFCEGEDQKKIMNILQQPPGEYKGKYIACIPSKEPEVVRALTEEEMKNKEKNQTEKENASEKETSE